MTKEEYQSFQERMNAMKKIIEINDPIKYTDLSEHDMFWAPEMRPLKYSQWVQKNYQIDSNNLVSVIIYSLLMNMPINELIVKMDKDTKSK